MVNGHKSAAHTHSPDGGTGKTCLGGGMHCYSVSSFFYRASYASAALGVVILSVRLSVRHTLAL